MKQALSRKNAWDAAPQSLKLLAGTILGRLPVPWILGHRFRRQMAFLNEAQWWSAERSRQYQLEAVRGLCALASERTPYYRRVFQSLAFDPRDLKDLEQLRLLPFLERSTLREHLADMCAKSPRSADVDYVSTGGTSGQPLQFYAESGRSAIEYAYLVSNWMRTGFRTDVSLAVLRGRVVRPDSSGLRHEFDPLLRCHYYSSFHLDDANMARYLEHIETIGPCYLHVYPSVVAVLAQFVRRSGLVAPSNVLGVLAESEIVYPDQRHLVEETFKRRYFSSYGLSEKVACAAECEGTTDYHVWPTYGHVELVDDNGAPVTRSGQRGEIVATGFSNRVVPFIRYRTGDYATYVADGCSSCGRQHLLITDVRGHRTQESLVAVDGSLVPWTALNMHDDTFAHVVRFQFRQEAPGQTLLRIVPSGQFNEGDRARIRKTLEERLDTRVHFTIQLVDEIPPSPRGKAVYVDQRIGRHAD